MFIPLEQNVHFPTSLFLLCERREEMWFIIHQLSQHIKYLSRVNNLIIFDIYLKSSNITSAETRGVIRSILQFYVTPKVFHTWNKIKTIYFLFTLPKDKNCFAYELSKFYQNLYFPSLHIWVSWDVSARNMPSSRQFIIWFKACYWFLNCTKPLETNPDHSKKVSKFLLSSCIHILLFWYLTILCVNRQLIFRGHLVL